MCSLLLGQQITSIHPCSQATHTHTHTQVHTHAQRNVSPLNCNIGFYLKGRSLSSLDHNSATEMKPIWAPFKIMQINISPDLLCVFKTFLSSLSYQHTERFSLSWGRMKGPSSLENQGRGEAWPRTDSCRTHWQDVMHG